MLRDEQHGTRTGYHYGCRCPACLDAERLYQRTRNRSGRDAGRVKEWQAQNRDYFLAYRRGLDSKVQSESKESATNRGRGWEEHEDALLANVTSDIAAASALGRTYWAVKDRRKRLRAKGILK